MIRWSVESILAIACRVARLHGVHIDEALPVIRIRDRQLLCVYVRGIGKVPA